MKLEISDLCTFKSLKVQFLGGVTEVSILLNKYECSELADELFKAAVELKAFSAKVGNESL